MKEGIDSLNCESVLFLSRKIVCLELSKKDNKGLINMLHKGNY